MKNEDGIEERDGVYHSRKFPGLAGTDREAVRRTEEVIETARREERTELRLAHSSLTSLPEVLGQLSQLQRLDFGNNRLTSLPEKLGQLSQLQRLDFSNNKLTSLPEELGRLSQLQKLLLFNNQLTSLPEALGQLSQLQEFTLHSNKLTSLPDALGHLSKLQRLDLQNNQLVSLPETLGQLSQLQTLHLSNNRLTSLPEALHKLAREGVLRHMYLHENTSLALPDEVLGATWRQVGGKGAYPARPLDILDYYFRIRGGKARAWRELKVIIVGRGNAGKTTLVDALQGKPFESGKEKTKGIAITPWEVDLKDGVEDGIATAHLWDFGGQQIMHGTHQFFMTHRALYLVVLDGRDDRTKQEAEYWLKLVRAFGGNSPVMLVLNKQDEHAYDIDRGYVIEKYGIHPKQVFLTACKTGEGIAELREAILKEAATMLAARERFPEAWWEMKTHLAHMKEDFLPVRDYHFLCAEKKVPKDDCDLLLRVLSELGTVVSFPDDVKLQALHVLNPEWATDGVYRVLNDRDLVEKREGKLAVSELKRILPKERWPEDKHQYLLNLMAKFQLCFPLDEEGRKVMVPELLPDQTPTLTDWKSEECLVFLYTYPALPHGVLPRFITRTHDLSEKGLRWRTGVTLHYESARALVRADYDKNQVSIWVHGPVVEIRRELLKAIRREFSIIHRSIKELGEKEWVAVPGHHASMELLANVTKDYARGRSTIPMTINGEREDYSIDILLNGVLTAEEREALRLLQGQTGKGRGEDLLHEVGITVAMNAHLAAPDVPRLNKKTFESARKALASAHPKGPAHVLRMMDDDANKYISVNVSVADQWAEVLEAANTNGWTGALLQEAIRQQPGHEALRSAAAFHGIALPEVRGSGEDSPSASSAQTSETAGAKRGRKKPAAGPRTGRKERGGDVFHIHGPAVIGRDVKQVDQRDHQEQNISGGEFHGPVGIEQTFTHCYQTVQKLPKEKATLKAALVNLLKVVQVLSPTLGATAAEEAVQAVEMLTTEATRHAPKMKRLQLGVEELMGAVEGQGGTEGPVAKAAAGVLETVG